MSRSVTTHRFATSKAPRLTGAQLGMHAVMLAVAVVAPSLVTLALFEVSPRQVVIIGGTVFAVFFLYAVVEWYAGWKTSRSKNGK